MSTSGAVAASRSGFTGAAIDSGAIDSGMAVLLCGLNVMPRDRFGGPRRDR
jgi:hypothetical protein